MIYKFTYMYDYKDMSHCPQKIVGEEKLKNSFLGVRSHTYIFDFEF